MGRTSDAKERILTAAQSLIEQRGYSALGVAEICKAAGVPKGSFYYFFDSKEELALAVLDEHWAGQYAGWNRILRGDARRSNVCGSCSRRPRPSSVPVSRAAAPSRAACSGICPWR
ncbi:HTH-type transcriptional repressor NemR [Streptomyces sp. MBT84]|nr:HTH-type transcriptional repressor NemR [Streptomyces sp. MBT84]